jgi:ubiquinone/menaquinone biosynthesis C-methylase UbiE
VDGHGEEEMSIPRELLDVARCPYTQARLRAEGDGLVAESGRTYRVVDGVPWLLDEETISALDRDFQRQYTERDARSYDRQVRLMSLLFGCWDPRERRKIANLLDLRLGMHVLEVSVGTGANLPLLARWVGAEGRLYGLDLSAGMLGVARKWAAALSCPVHLMRGDAVHLPFADGAFDAVLHFGGVNLFGDRARALEEMVRVAKPGATLVVGDEGMSEARRASWLGRQLVKMNNLYRFRPPFHLLPWDRIENVQLHWVWREVFWLLRFQRSGGSGSPDEGEALRQRLEARSAGVKP